MPLVIENRGSGFLGEIGDWSISQNGSPMTLGDSAGRLGSLNFSAGCDSTSKFTIDNYLSVKHYADNQLDRMLSTFDGYIRSVETNGKTGRFGMISPLSALDVERTSKVGVSGTLQRSIRIPAGEEYEINGVTYTIGGYWTSVGSENVFVPRPTTIWDVASGPDYIYVLCAGQHLGEVVVQIGIDGVFRDVWPVYSDATDVASPDARYIVHEEGYLYIGQVNADRIKKFYWDGTFITQWGSAGTGNGQFNTISGIAVSEGYNAVYVTDSVLGRVQRFTETGTYDTQWGTLGTGAGNTVFNAPNGISVDPITGDVLVSDRNARVRAYNFNGAYLGQVAGSYDFTASRSTGEFTAGGYRISTTFDQRGNVYAIQRGKVFKYVRKNGGWASAGSSPNMQWDSAGLTDISEPDRISGDPFSGIIHVPRASDIIDQYAGSLGSLAAHILYYIALAKPDFPVRLLALNSEWDYGELAVIAWQGNVWQQLCDLCAATSNAMVMFDDSLFFLNRNSRSYQLPIDADITPVRLDSRGGGRSVEIVNQRSRYTNVQEVLYSAEADNRRTFNVNVNDFTYVTVSQNTYPEYVNNPTPSTTTGDGQYVVVDSNFLTVDPTAWTNYGGKVLASVGERPGTILLNIVGPGLEIPGYESPYRIATVGNAPSLSIMGAGVVASPEVLRIGTGISEDVSNRTVGKTIHSPFAFNATIAYSEGSWAAYNMGTPDQRYTIRMRVNKTNPWVNDVTGIGGTAAMVGMIVEHDDAQYVVDTLDYNATTITLGVYRYTKLGWEEYPVSEYGTGISARPEEIWTGKFAGEFDAYWAEYTAQDFTIAPLRNPFDV